MNRLPRSPVPAMLAISVLLSGCFQNEVDLGGSGSPQPVTWRGYVENHQFGAGPGSDAIELHLDSMDPGPLTGTIRFGNAPDLPPATDPEVWYPPGVMAPQVRMDRPSAGFDYSLQNGEITAVRLDFRVYSAEIWKDWCEMQVDWSGPGGCHSLAHGYGVTNDPCEVDGVYYDCGKVALCREWQVCACEYYQGCTSITGQEVEVDLKISGDQMHGSAIGLDSQQHPMNIWLQRVEE